MSVKPLGKFRVTELATIARPSRNFWGFEDSKTNLKGITLEIRPVWGITLHALLYAIVVLLETFIRVSPGCVQVVDYALTLGKVHRDLRLLLTCFCLFVFHTGVGWASFIVFWVSNQKLGKWAMIFSSYAFL